MHPSIEIRLATVQDAEQISLLIRELGYAMSPQQLRQKLIAAQDSKMDRVMVAVSGEQLLGCISLHVMPLFHAEGNLGRITALVVSEQRRSQGIGHALILQAHQWFEAANCMRFEVTSGDQRERAHRFYERHGYARQGQRLLRKSLLE
jgi:ribosomal protein S18 acetylase RimI-like enzyme